MKNIKSTFLLIFCLIGSIQSIFAHGDLHERIVEVTEEIKVQPDSSFLYFKRGKLYFQHKDYKEAIQDIFTANDLGFEDAQCDLIMAKSNKALLDYHEAHLYLDKILKKTPNHVIALKTSAEIYFEQREYEKAAINFEKVIEFAIKTNAHNYLQAHRAWKELDTFEADRKANEVLEKGIEELGSIFTLLEEQKRFHLARKNYEKAILIQEQIIEMSFRKETAYFQAAELCSYLPDEIKKKQYLQNSLNAIFALPPRKQQNKAMVQLRRSIELELDKVGVRIEELDN